MDDLMLELNVRDESILEYMDVVGYGIPLDIEIYPDPGGYETSCLVQL